MSLSKYIISNMEFFKYYYLEQGFSTRVPWEVARGSLRDWVKKKKGIIDIVIFMQGVMRSALFQGFLNAKIQCRLGTYLITVIYAKEKDCTSTTSVPRWIDFLVREATGPFFSAGLYTQILQNFWKILHHICNTQCAIGATVGVTDETGCDWYKWWWMCDWWLWLVINYGCYS